MGVVIAGTGVYHESGITSVIVSAAGAARRALDDAGATPESVGVLINVGVYRDSNMIEPAMAALILKEAGFGLDYAEEDPRTFAFDLMNGACGVLNAAQVASALLSTSDVARVLVVAGDTHPSLAGRSAFPEFPYAPPAAAFLLEHRDSPDGFGEVHVELAAGPAGCEGFYDAETMGCTGRSAITLRQSDDFEDRVLAVAARAGARALDGVDRSTTALISSRPTPGFLAALSQQLGVTVLNDGADGPRGCGEAHTAALPLAYHDARESGRLNDVRSVLMIAAGAGPSAAAALYRMPEGTPP